jgi:hypothetical protein
MKNASKVLGVAAVIAAIGFMILPLGCSNSTTPSGGKTLISIAVTDLPTKIQYNVGEELDTAGMVVTATYSDNSTKAVTGYTTTGYNKTVTGDQTITVTYQQKTAVFTVTVTGSSGGKTPVGIADITIATPISGRIPVTTVSSTVNFTAGTVIWSPNDNPFRDGTVYTATVILTAASGYTFTGLATANARINGKTAAVSNNTGETVTLSYTFTVTGIKAASGITIKSPPDKLSYTHGETLDLAGLVITLTYDDTSTEDAAAADFTGKNITANPTQGDSLVRATHNDHPITISYGRLTVNTGNITVNAKNASTLSIDPIPAQTYTGSGIEPAVTVRDGAKTLTLTTDYTVSYGNNTNVGTDTAAVTITGTGNYTGSKTVNFTINKITGYAVNTPALNSKTNNSITVNSVSAATDQTVQYAISTTPSAPSGGWQTGTTFTGLNADTTYYIFACAMENASYNTGTPSPGLSVTTNQEGTAKIVYYWINQHDSLVTTDNDETSIHSGETLIITSIAAENDAYMVSRWTLNGVNTGQDGNTYHFSSTALGTHIIGLFVEKDGKPYNTNINITVTE